MKQFDFNPLAEFVTITWKCPDCDEVNESDAFYVPTPNYEAETHRDSEWAECYEGSCRTCGHLITVELYNGFCGGSGVVDLDDSDVLDIDIEYPDENDDGYEVASNN